MKILEVSRYKNNFADHQLPFVTEQGQSLQAAGCQVDFFLVKGNYLTAGKALKTKIRDFQPDIVHAHYGLSAITAELQNEVPVVTTFHNGETANRLVNFVSSLFSLRAKHVIYVAEHIPQLLYFVNSHHTILPCGVSLEDCTVTPYTEARRQLGWNDDTYYILFGGRFHDLRKNVVLLREAVDGICKMENGKCKTEIIEMSGLTREQCVLRMSACDLFALPTKNEGSPQALKEAMACGCPIVATDCADIKFLLGNLEGHYLLSNKNTGRHKNAYWVGNDKSIEELRGKIEEAMLLPRGFRTKGRNRIIELGYTNELVAEKLIEIYKQVL